MTDPSGPFFEVWVKGTRRGSDAVAGGWATVVIDGLSGMEYAEASGGMPGERYQVACELRAIAEGLKRIPEGGLAVVKTTLRSVAEGILGSSPLPSHWTAILQLCATRSVSFQQIGDERSAHEAEMSERVGILADAAARIAEKSL
jgi:hypothetical protein